MKRLSKLLIFTFVLMLGMGFAIVGAMTGSAYADTQATPGFTYSDAFSIKQIPSSATFGEAVTLYGATGVDLVVKGPDGVALTQYDLANEEQLATYNTANGNDVIGKKADGNYTLKPVHVGYYTIQYSSTTGVKVFSPEYKMLVKKGASYTYEFEYNSAIVLPAQANTSKDIILPFPAAYNADGAELIGYNGAATTAGAGYTYRIVVKMDNKTMSSEGASGSIVALTKNTEGYYFFTPVEGTITVEYTLMKNGVAVAQPTTKTISCDSAYDTSKTQLSITVTGMPTTSTASLGSKVYLPLPSVTDKGNVGSTVNFYTTITVKTGDTAVTVSKDDDGMYFIPTIKADYVVTYNVKDFYGKTLAEPYSQTIVNIHDTKSPKIYLVDTYIANKAKAEGYDADFIKSLVSTTFDVPYKVNASTVINFPAIYGVDEFVGYSNLTMSRKLTGTINNTYKNIDLNNYKYHVYESTNGLVEGTYETLSGSDLTAYKTWIEDDSDTTYYVIKEQYRNMYNVPFDFDSNDLGAGDYTITYRVSDGTTSATTFTRTITLGNYTDHMDEVKVTFESFPTVVRNGQEVTIVPVLSDYYDNDIEVSYKVNEVVVVPNADKSLTFTAASTMVNAGKISIEATATNDFVNTNVITKYISFIDSTADADAPEFDEWNYDGFPETKNTFNQYADVYVPGVVMTDADAYVRKYFEVRQIVGDEYKVVTGAKLIGTTIQDGISFKGNVAAKYLVTYIAEDTAGNITVVGAVTTAALNDKQAPTISRESKDYTMELGTELDLGEITATDNVGTPTITVTSDSDGYLISDTLFVPRALGTYTITISAIDANNNAADDVTLTVNVVDKTAPVIVMNNGDVYEQTLRVMPNSDGDFAAVTIPSFTGYDVQTIVGSLSEIGIASTEVKVAGPNSTTYTVDTTSTTYKLTKNANGTYTFTPATKGSYTITYTATDLNGNTATPVTINLQAGDTVPPVITVTNEEIKTAAKPGYTFTLKTSEISVKDAVDGTLAFKTIKVLDSKNAEVEATLNEAKTEYTYKLDDAGVYTLEITGTDKAGNTQTYTKSITIAEDTKDSMTKNEIIGTVLIVIAVLVLAGVIIYFVRTRTKKIKK